MHTLCKRSPTQRATNRVCGRRTRRTGVERVVELVVFNVELVELVEMKGFNR